MSLTAVLLVDDAAGATVTEDGGRRPARPGEALGLDALAGALRERTGVAVTLTDRLPDTGVDDGTMLVLPQGTLMRALESGALDPDLRARVVVAGSDRTTTLALLEREGLAGAIATGTLLSWRDADPDARASIVGRLDVAAAMDAEADPASDDARYGRLSSAAHPDLASLLAAYLAACSAGSR